MIIMSNYAKQNFVSGQVLKAEHLNHMEDGIGQISEDLFDVTYIDTFTWDGTIGNRFHYTTRNSIITGGVKLGTLDITWVKISDYCPDINIFKNNPSSYTVYEEGAEPIVRNFNANQNLKEKDGYYEPIGGNAMVVHSPNVQAIDNSSGEDVQITLETGLYYCIQITTITMGTTEVTTQYTSELRSTVPIVTVKTIKEELVPVNDNYALKSDINELSEKIEALRNLISTATT